ALVHPEGVYDDPKAGALRETLYRRLRRHFQFANEKNLFPEVHHHTQFSVNVYGGPLRVKFDSINSLYDPATVDDCYTAGPELPLPTMKDKEGKWNTSGHPDRVINVGPEELKIFASIFEGDKQLWPQTKLPRIYAHHLIDILQHFARYPRHVGDLDPAEFFTTNCWDETKAQKYGITKAEIKFPAEGDSVIYAGAQIGIANPYFQAVRRYYKSNSDYDRLDLTELPQDYRIRTKYQPACSLNKYYELMARTPWGCRIDQEYRLISRCMIGCDSERSWTCAIAARGFAHVHAVFSLSLKNSVDMVCLAGCEASIVYDFLVRSLGKGHVNYNTSMLFPLLNGAKNGPIILRALLLNCLTKYYADLWSQVYQDSFAADSWAKEDPRLNPDRFRRLSPTWSAEVPLRSDYERRQALIELDVLTAQALGLTLEQLRDIYLIQFPVLQSYEADTWYDRRGRIVFTNNRSLTGVGLSRSEWQEAGQVKPVQRGEGAWDGTVKNAPAGYVFKQTVTDDTQPEGPRQRDIEYYAPFDRCDRLQDYATAWRFFAQRKNRS
ncbi:MAG: class I SAM-dependent DNA methyltransferase, partial [Candidatus Bruticola sp.]